MGTEQVSLLLFVIAAIYGIVSSLQMPLGRLEEPGPGLFPLCLSGLLFLLASLGLGVSLVARNAISNWKDLWGDLRKPIKILLCSAIAIYFFESIGFLITSAFFLFLLLWWVSGFRAWKALILGMAGGLAGWVLFVKVLGVPMPEGIFGL